MSDGDDNALTVATSHLPARTALVDRGLMLATRISAREPRTAQSVLDDYWSNAQHAYITALEMSDRAAAEGSGRELFREACLDAYRWAVEAAMVALEIGQHPPILHSDLLYYISTADWFVNHEGYFSTDISKHLVALQDDNFDANVLAGLVPFLDEVADFPMWFPDKPITPRTCP